MVRPELAAIGTEVEIDILGTRHGATVIGESPWDPENERLRG
jgi:dimethylglycine dehydrogenase